MGKKLKTLNEHNSKAWTAHQSWADMSKPQPCKCGYIGFRLE
jgi:hypothetical protein